MEASETEEARKPSGSTKTTLVCASGFFGWDWGYCWRRRCRPGLEARPGRPRWQDRQPACGQQEAMMRPQGFGRSEKFDQVSNVCPRPDFSHSAKFFSSEQTPKVFFIIWKPCLSRLRYGNCEISLPTARSYPQLKNCL